MLQLFKQFLPQNIEMKNMTGTREGLNKRSIYKRYIDKRCINKLCLIKWCINNVSTNDVYAQKYNAGLKTNHDGAN